MFDEFCNKFRDLYFLVLYATRKPLKFAGFDI